MPFKVSTARTTNTPASPPVRSRAQRACGSNLLSSNPRDGRYRPAVAVTVQLTGLPGFDATPAESRAGSVLQFGNSVDTAWRSGYRHGPYLAGITA